MYIRPSPPSPQITVLSNYSWSFLLFLSRRGTEVIACQESSAELPPAVSLTGSDSIYVKRVRSRGCGRACECVHVRVYVPRVLIAAAVATVHDSVSYTALVNDSRRNMFIRWIS